MAPGSRGGVLVLGGATASGKTAFAIALAERYDAEIVGADSRQIYRDMAVGTAAPTAADRARVPHHLVGYVDPYERFSAARFVADATAAIGAVHARGKRTIVVGGSGFYLRALCGDVELGAEPDPAVRERVRQEVRTHPLDVLHAWLQARNAPRAAAVSAGDPYRIARALEIELGSATGRGRAVPLPTLRRLEVPFVKLALRIDVLSLESRIASRTDLMLAGGLIDEAERIGLRATAADAVGYQEALAYRAGQLTFAELRALLIRSTRRYAKRQLTWLRGEPGLSWIDLGDFPAVDAAVAQIGWQLG